MIFSRGLELYPMIKFDDKAIGFEILLATSLSKFGESSSVLCAFTRQSFFKQLQISDRVNERNENFWIFRIAKFFGLFHTKSFIGCRDWSSVVAMLEKNWPNPLAMVSLFNMTSSFTLSVVLVSFDLGLVENILFSVLQNEVEFSVLLSSSFFPLFVLCCFRGERFVVSEVSGVKS